MNRRDAATQRTVRWPGAQGPAAGGLFGMRPAWAGPGTRCLDMRKAAPAGAAFGGIYVSPYTFRQQL